MDHWVLGLIVGMMGSGLVMQWYTNEALRKIHAILRARHDLDFHDRFYQADS